ncbi:amidase [Paracraurococcus lichenis]|uniref:Amidase n=1 Tax=Paracraurococcus lichenis TaxID=3064888 RepID=A0ABT9E9A1_9PROT|nr:amidase [Paracraurococcus sp. LOR1-02]MDO9712765.1 amidase [Paracraurococcus sp. LOR1-02]
MSTGKPELGLTAAAVEGRGGLREASDLPPASGMSDLVMLDAVELSHAIHAKRVSCREVMEAHLDHIGRMNLTANAIVSLRSREALVAEARERDDRLARGEPMGWMHGFPHAVKDFAATAGLRTTFGSPLFEDHVPQTDAIIVERMRAAGAIIIGKTNTPEWALGSQTYNPVFGTTTNAYDPSRTAGGSSGGAAVALALRMVPVADGSDAAGSVRNPAGWNNVVGLRPSRGRVPYGPTPEVFVQQFGTEGPMGRSVADTAMLLAVMAGPDARNPLSLEENPRIFAQSLERDVCGLRVGWLGGLAEQLPFEPGVLDLCRSALGTFGTLGCIVEDVKLDFPRERIWDSFVTLRSWMTAGTLQPLYTDLAKRAHLKPEAIWEVETGMGLSGNEVFAASVARSELYQSVRGLLERFDYLVLPTAQVFPFDAETLWPKEINGTQMDSYHRWMEVVALPTLCGLPTIAMPAGFDPRGLPMGLQIIGSWRDDLGVLQLAKAFESAADWTHKVLPPVLQSS